MGLEVITDCKMVQDVWGFGPGQNLEDIAYSEIWRGIFDLSEVVGRDLISVRRVRSHLSLGQARRQGVSEWEWRGNKRADELAKIGAQAHPTNPLIKAQLRHSASLVKQSAWIIAEVMSDLSIKDFPDVTRVRRPRRPKPQVLQLIPEPNGHLIDKVGKQYRCATCGERPH